eukprot:437759_1
MNPNVPSWQQQNQNNQSQQPQQRVYQAQQQAYNPYVAQQQAQYNPYAQQQYVPQQQSQQYPAQQGAYNPYNQQQQQFQQAQPQFGGYGQQPQQNVNPYRQTQPQQHPQQPQQFNPQYNQQHQPMQFNRYQQNNPPQQYQNQPRQPQVQQQVQPRNDDNWDQMEARRSEIKIASKTTNAMNDLDKSDEDQSNANQNQQKKKKKRRRGGRNKNKNKDKDTAKESNTSYDVPMAAPPKPKQQQTQGDNAVKEVTAKIETLKIDKEKKAKKSASSSASSSPPQVKPKEEKPKEEKPKAKEEKKCEEKKKKKKRKRVVWDAHDPREHLNLVLIGHVDAGKSTISGQILLATNQIDKRTIAKYKKEAKEKNRESWWIAYIMDEDDEERNKGKTVECGRAHFDTAHRRYTILDAPGHKNYVPNMISGAQQADVAILVISARRGEFEAGFDRGGQTREHALLALTLGISRIVIVVNKMDTMDWSRDRYDDIEKRVTKFLCEDIGFKKKYIDILPISGQSAMNIKEAVPKDICPWYSGDTLIQTLDELKKVKRATGDCLRIPILDRYKGDKGLQAIGKVEAGIIKKGDQVMIMPSEVMTQIVGLSIDDTPVESGGAGENILITFDKGALTMDQIYSGCVICSAAQPTKVVEQFLAEIYIHEIPGGGIMTSGYQAMFHCHNVTTMAEIMEIPHKLHRKTMKRSKVAPSFLRSHDRAIATIKLDQKCALESFDDCAPLGRFTLRDRGKTVVIGKIRQIVASKSRLKSARDKN